MLTEQNRPKSICWMKKKCCPFIIVFYTEHISVQLVLINVYWFDGLCLSFENKIPFWEEITLFWMWSFILQANWGFLPIVWVIFDLCVELWEYEACFQKMCVNNREKLLWKYARLIAVYVISYGQCYVKKILYFSFFLFSPGNKLNIKRRLLRS